MEDNSEVIHTAGQPYQEPPSGKAELARLYLSTCEILARYAYEATAKQQQLNILAQQVTVENTKTLYAILS